MARYLSRAIFATGKQSVFSIISRSNATASSSAVIPNSSSFLFRIRPLVAAVSYYGRLPPSLSTRGFATRQTSSSLSDPNPNWSNRPPKETIRLDGCDFEHWLVVMEKPEGDPTRDEIIDGYIKTLAMIVGSEEEARMKIYSVSTRHYFAFGALVTEEASYKIKELPKVRWVLPDSYLDVKNKDYGGEPFINGQAVPYDPKYHEEWVRNNARANERNRRNDRPRNFDRSRNFDRRREGQMSSNQNPGGPGSDMGVQPNRPPLPPNSPTGPGAIPPSNIGAQQNYVPNNPGNYPSRGTPNNAPHYQYGPDPNNGGPQPYQSGPGLNQNQSGFGPGVGPSQGQNQNAYANAPTPYQNQNVPGRDMPPSSNNFSQNRGFGPGQDRGNFAPPNTVGYNAGPNQSGSGNMGPGPGQSQNSYAPNNQNGYGNTSQNQNVPGRDFPTRPNY